MLAQAKEGLRVIDESVLHVVVLKLGRRVSAVLAENCKPGPQ